MAWDMYSRLDEDYTMPVVESQSRPKRRKKVSPSLTTDTHTAVPIALHKKFFYDESQTPLVLGFFEVVVHSVLASFLPSEHDTAPLPSETNQLQSVELVSGESATSLVVKQSVAEPFCCCFSVSLNPASRYIQSLAFLVKSRQVCVSAREDQLHDLFALAARVALSGDILVSPMTLTLTVHLVDAAAFAPASSNALGGRGTYGKQVTALVSHLNAPYCPSHLRPASEKNIEPVFLPTFKRIQLFYLTVKELQRRGGAVDELNLGELNAHLPGTCTPSYSMLHTRVYDSRLRCSSCMHTVDADCTDLLGLAGCILFVILYTCFCIFLLHVPCIVYTYAPSAHLICAVECVFCLVVYVCVKA